MMTDLSKPPFIDLLKAATGMLSAHKAVQDGIATHAEKEHAARQAQYHKMESEKKQQVAANVHTQTVRPPNH